MALRNTFLFIPIWIFKTRNHSAALYQMQHKYHYAFTDWLTMNKNESYWLMSSYDAQKWEILMQANARNINQTLFI